MCNLVSISQHFSHAWRWQWFHLQLPPSLRRCSGGMMVWTKHVLALSSAAVLCCRSGELWQCRSSVQTHRNGFHLLTQFKVFLVEKLLKHVNLVMSLMMWELAPVGVCWCLQLAPWGQSRCHRWGHHLLICPYMLCLFRSCCLCVYKCHLFVCHFCNSCTKSTISRSLPLLPHLKQTIFVIFTYFSWSCKVKAISAISSSVSSELCSSAPS